ncbi:type VI secretion system baseplate subunit TssF [Klebsiella pneumoniae subsp. pneumoniae]|nr:type VI secretion system baseplate subunit TssF [Klebsiella pneumoniae subsp. pneumoniae]
MMRRHAPERYYHTRVKRGVTGMHDTWLILGGQQWEADRELARETVSLRITGTNGRCRAGRYRARCWIAVSRYQPRRLPSAISVGPRCRPIPRRKTATTGGS